MKNHHLQEVIFMTLSIQNCSSPFFNAKLRLSKKPLKKLRLYLYYEP